MIFHRRLLLLLCLAAASSATSAGTVSVSFIQPKDYWDAGNTSFDEDANLKALAAHLQRLGQRLLPADQSLEIEVLQVDLAGTVKSSLFPGRPVRTITGGTDWPRLHLRYSLQAAGKAAVRGEEWVSDLDYTHGLARRSDNEALYYEKRMLEQWFKARFVIGPAAPG